MTSKSNKVQSPGNPAAIANRVSSIAAIRQIAGSFQLHAAAGASIENHAVPVNSFDVDEPYLEGDVLQLVLTFSFDAFVKPEAGTADGKGMDERAKLFEAKGKFAVAYILDGDEECSKDDLLAFAHVNGPLNLVPYWREALSSFLTRAGMPAYEAPVFNSAKLAMEMASAKSAEQPKLEEG